MLPGLYFPLDDVQPLWAALGGVGVFVPSRVRSRSNVFEQMEAEDADDESD